MLKNTLDRLSKDFDKNTVRNAVHEYCHAIFAEMNEYKVLGVKLEGEITDGFYIDGRVDVDFSPDKEVIKNLCNKDFNETIGEKQRYERCGSFYLRLLLIGLVSEEILLKQKISYDVHTLTPVPEFDTTLGNTDDGRRCRIVLLNINNHKLGISEVIEIHRKFLIKIIESCNFQLVLEKLLLETFYLDLKDCNLVNTSANNVHSKNIQGLLAKWPIQVPS